VRAVIDTNVLLAGLLWHGPPHEVLVHVRSERLAMLCSPALLDELSEVLARPKFDAILARIRASREELLSEIEQLADVIDPPPLPDPTCRDRDDDHVLAIALAAHADWIITGDHDLLVLQNYHGTSIVTPAKAVELLGS
jgi:putative PIN family toxin of toxin-antitoxin system